MDLIKFSNRMFHTILTTGAVVGASMHFGTAGQKAVAHSYYNAAEKEVKELAKPVVRKAFDMVPEPVKHMPNELKELKHDVLERQG
jgi:hypothetical protein